MTGSLGGSKGMSRQGLASSLAASVHGRLCAVPVCWVGPREGDWGGDGAQDQLAHIQNKGPSLAQLLPPEQPWVHSPALMGLAGSAACIPLVTARHGLSPPPSSSPQGG